MTNLSRLILVLTGLVVPALALASEGGGECSPDKFCFPIQGYYIIDFLAFVGILVWAGRKPIAAMLDKRYQDVSKEIAQAQEAKAAAQARYDEYTQRIAKLQDEVTRMLAEVRAGTQAEVEALQADAKVQIERMLSDEQLRIAQESKRLREELEKEAAALALQLAEQTLRQRLDATAQQRLVDKALQDLSKLPAGQQAAG